MIKLSNRLGANKVFGSTPDPKEFGYLNELYSEAAGTSFTFSSESLGTAYGSRNILLTVAARHSGSDAALNLAVTVDGISATLVGSIVDVGSGNVFKGFIYAANVPLGSTGDIVVVSNLILDWLSAGLYRSVGYSTTPVDVKSQNNSITPSVTMTTVNNGFIIAGAINNAAGGTITMSNVTRNYLRNTDPSGGNDGAASGSFSPTTGANRTVSANCTGGVVDWCSIIAASFQQT